MKRAHKPGTAEPDAAPAQARTPAAVAAPSPRGPLTPARIVALQRLVGNAAVSALVDERRPGAGAEGGGGTAPLGPSILDDIAAAQGEGAGAATGGAAPEAPESAASEATPAAAEAAPSAAAAFDAVAETGSPAASAAPPAAEAATGASPPAAEAAAGAPPAAAAALDGAAGASPPAAEAAAGAPPAAAAALDGAAGASPPAAEAAAGAPPAAAAAFDGAAAGAPPAAAAARDGAAAGSPPAPAAAGAPPAASPAAKAADAAASGASPKAAAPEGPAEAKGADVPAAAFAGPAADPVIRDPHADPKFQAMKGKTKQAATGSKQHTPAPAGAASAQAAAVPPANDASSQAQAAQVDEMSEQKPGTFDRAAFIAAVREAIDKAAPKNLEEADNFKADGVKDAVGGQVKDGKKGAEKDIKGATDATPDPSKAKPKQVTPMSPDHPGQATTKVGAKDAMPDKASDKATDLSGGPDAIDKQMSDADVTDEQIHKSNEPDFKAALGERDKLSDHADKAPQQYRAKEQEILAKAHGGAEQAEATHLQGMHSARTGALGKAEGHKQGAKSEDEGKRAKVANDIQGIYDRTKADVTKTLDGLDGKVDAAFSQGEGAARKRFEDSVSKRMDAYKDDRYGGILGPAKWLKDKLMGLPSEVNQFYADGRKQYLADMDGVIGKVADLVGAELTSARARIAQGKAEVHKYVTGLPKDLQQVGKDAESKLESQFDQLSSDVDSKQNELVDTLARKYVDARDALDARIDEMKAANKGLVDKAIDAIGGVIKTILQLKNMLMSILAKAADVIGDIIKDPIGFLGKLIDGIKSGLNRFVGNIAAHLQEGLMGWLFGTLGGAGITIPKTFDLSGIVDLVLQVLGLTYQNIRNRVVKIVGEPAMQRMEQTVDVFKTLVSEGVGGLWRWIKDRVGDLEDLVLGSIKTFIIEKVIKAGVVWLIAFLNPAAAFIKACKMIVDVITFLIERGSEIMAFVNSILDSVGAIAKGAIGVVAEKVESSLAKALPLAISFLASLLGLGGISEKIHQVIDKVRAPISKAVDFVVMGAVKGFRKLFGKAKGWVKGKAKGAKDWATGKARGVRDALTGRGRRARGAGSTATDGKDPDGDRETRLKSAVAEAKSAMKAPGATVETVEAKLPGIQQRYKLTSLKLEKDGEYSYRPHAVINPEFEGPPGVLFTPAQIAELEALATKWAGEIRADGDEAAFRADPVAYLTPGEGGKTKKQIGDVVEVAAGAELDAIAAEGGLTVLRNVLLRPRMNRTRPSGQYAEIDFLILGTKGVQEVVSAKLNPKRLKGLSAESRGKLKIYKDCPSEETKLRTFMADPANKFGSADWSAVVGMDVESSAGSMPIAEFQSRYLSMIPVEEIKVEGVTPGPGRPLGYQLRATTPQLIQKMAELVTARL